MSDNQWAYDFESKMFTIFATLYRKKFLTKYPNLLITSESQHTGEPRFPAVLLNQVGMTEVGRDLEGDVINGISPTFQTTISFVGSNDELRQLAYYAMDIFKTKRFSLSEPVYGETDGVKTATFRASRVVGANDVF